jgi:hypothetical protein
MKNRLDILVKILPKCPLMNQPTIKKISIAFVATLALGTMAFAGGSQNLRTAPGRSVVSSMSTDSTLAVPFGNNLVLDACTGCNYDSLSGGYYVWGTNNCESPGTTQWIAVPFYSAKAGIPRKISASINLDNACTSTSSKVTLSIYSDACAGAGNLSAPGTSLVGGAATVPAAPCAVANATLRNAPSLTLGTKYWVVATTSGATQDGLSAIYYASNPSLIGGDVANGGWFSFSGLVPGFTVQ